MGTSFAQVWVNKTGGHATAAIGQTLYANINVWNRSLIEKVGSKLSRMGKGYNEKGSKYFPVEVSGVTWNTFSPIK